MNTVNFINLCLDNDMPVICGIDPKYYDTRFLSVDIGKVNLNLKAYRTGHGNNINNVQHLTKTIERLPKPPYLNLWYNSGVSGYPSLVINLIGQQGSFAHLLNLVALASATDLHSEKGMQSLVEDRLIPILIHNISRYYTFIRSKVSTFDIDGNFEGEFIAQTRKLLQRYII